MSTLGAASEVRTVRRLDSLTGLRIVAALLVVLLHTVDSDETQIVELPWLRHAVSLGALGVPFFFALSGFVLTWSSTPGDRTGDFYRRRFARIYPLHAATWAVACLAILASGTELPPAGAFLSLVLLQSWVPDGRIYFAANGVSWSLSCEALFYALTPLLLPALLRRSRLVVAGSALALMLAAALLHSARGGSTPFDLFVFPPFALGFFVVGMCCALLVRDGVRSPVSLTTACALTTAVYSVCTVLTALAELPLTVAAIVFLMPIALLLVAAADHDLHGQRRSLFAAPVMVRLGEWSFALYMIHTLLLRAMVKVLGWTPPTGLLANVVVEVVFVLGAVLASGAAYVLWERPFERRLRPPRREVRASETGRGALGRPDPGAGPRPAVEDVRDAVSEEGRL